MTPAELLVAVRRRQGLTQAELARRAGTSQPVVSAYEHGRRDPTFATLAKLIAAGGERLEIGAAVPPSDLAPPTTLEEHARRLLDVLSLADAVPSRPSEPGPARTPARLVSDLTLAERIVAIDGALDRVPHAFGGALALAYYAEPRATIDIDLNVFVGPDRFVEVAGPLTALGADADDPDVAELVRRDGQARVMWDATPIDLFFAYDRFHAAAALTRR